LAFSKSDALVRYLRTLSPGAVAFSGGVDSTLLLYLAREAWGDGVTAVTFLSPLLPEEERTRIQGLIARFKVRHFWLKSFEYRDPDFQKNPPDRCYYCKKHRIGLARERLRRRRIPHLLDGTNADDLNAYRPGIRAAREGGIISPFAEFHWTKKEIRTVSRTLGLPTWDLPSSPCLATRVAYGQPITLSLLRRLGRGEKLLHDRGFKETRLRLHGNLLRLEIPPDQFPRILDTRKRKALVRDLSALGFPYLTLDLMGLRSGSMDEVLSPKKRKG
jgi:uncharacterized protein